MKSPLAPRSLRFESLETRDLLAGNVLVRLGNGALFVTGDNLDNGLTIERILDPAGASSLLITPDATTSINGGQAGVAITLADFNRDGQVDLLGGSDSLTLIGNNFGDSFPNTALRCSTGSGNDKIQIESWSWGSSIAIDNSDGQDEFSLSQVRVGSFGSGGGAAGGGSGGSITLKSPKSTSLPTVAILDDVTVTQSSSKLTALSLDTVSATITDSDFLGAMKYTCAKGNHIPTIKLTACTASSLSVVQRGGGLDFSAERCAFFDVFVDVEASIDSATGQLFGSSISLIDDDCDGIVTLRSVGETDVTVDGCSASDMFLKFYRPTNSARSDNAQVSLSDLSVTRRLSIEARGGLDVTVERTAAVDMFLKLEGIKGELHRSSLVLTNCPTVTHLSLRSTEQIDLDLSSSSFFDVFADISSLNGLPPGEPVLRVKMTDILVSSYCAVSTRVGAVDAEISSSKFEVCSFSFGASNAGSSAVGGGGGAGKVSMHDISITKSASLSVSGLYDVEVSSLAAVDLYLKLDRASVSQTFSTVDCDDVDLTGRMSLESTGALAVSLDSCSASDMYLKLGGIKGELHRSSVSVVDSSASSRLSLTSLVTCDVDLQRSSFFDVFIDVTRSASPPGEPYLQIKLEEVLVSGYCSVSTKGGPVDASISSSSFEVCSFSFGASNPSTLGSGGGGGAGKVNVHDISITKSASLSLSSLYDVTVSSLSAVDFFVKLDRTLVSSSFSTVAFTDLDLDGRLSLESVGALDVSLESCSASDMFIKLGGVKGELHRSSLSITDSSSSSRLSLTSLVTCDVSLESSRFFDVFVDVTRSASPPGTPYLQIKMSDLLVSGYCSVSTKGGAVEADIGGSTFEGSCSFSFGASNPSTLGSGGGGGAGKVSVHDISVTKSASLSASGLYDVAVSSLAAVDFFLKLDRTTVSQQASTVVCDNLQLSGALSLHSTGAVTSTYALCYSVDNTVWIQAIKGETLRSSVSMVDSSVSSRLSLTSTSTCDVSLESSSFHDVAVSVTRSASPPAEPYMKITLSDLLVSGFCTVSGQGGADADVSDSTFEKSLSFSWGLSQTGTFATGSGGGAGKVSVHDISVTNSLSIASRGETLVTALACTAGDMFVKLDRVTRLADNSAIVLSQCAVENRLSIEGRGGTDVSVEGGTFASIFMKFDGIKGELHRQTVSLDDLTGNSLRVVSGEPQDFSLTRAAFFDVFCDVSAPSSTSPGAALASSSLLEDLTVFGSLSVTTSGGSHVLNMRRCTCPTGQFVQNSPSGRSSQVTITDSSFTSSLSVVTRGENHVSLDACTAFDTYLKFERLTSGQPGASSVSLDGLVLDGALSIHSRGSLDVTSTSCRAVDMFLKIEGVQGERRSGEVSLGDFVVTKRMDVSSTCPLDLTIDGGFASDLFIKIDRIGTITDGSRVSVTDTDCDDAFVLSTSSGADVVVLDDVTTHGRAMVSLGAGDDRLSVLDCAFDEVSLFDGGAGFDRLTVDAVFSASNLITSWDLKTNK